MRLLGGCFAFDSPDAALLVSLLPSIVHVRGVERLSVLVRLVGEEASERRPGRDLVLTRLVEVLLIEALRAAPGDDAPPGLLRGLADARLAPAIRQMHGQLARSWTVAQLAKTAALSRSAFFERFTRTVGLPPMEYLLAWRMAVAKDLLRRQDLGLAEVAERVGYGSASTFSTAFSRHVGQSPGRYGRAASARLIQVESAGNRQVARFEQSQRSLMLSTRRDRRRARGVLRPRFDPAAVPPAGLKQKVDAWVAANQRTIVTELVELLAIPNIAADRENIRKNATRAARDARHGAG